MTKRRKGQIPYESPHPNRPEMPDVPGHRQRNPTINKEQKELLDAQIKKLAEELNIKVGNPENKG